MLTLDLIVRAADLIMCFSMSALAAHILFTYWKHLPKWATVGFALLFTANFAAGIYAFEFVYSTVGTHILAMVGHGAWLVMFIFINHLCENAYG